MCFFCLYSLSYSATDLFFGSQISDNGAFRYFRPAVLLLWCLDCLETQLIPSSICTWALCQVSVQLVQYSMCYCLASATAIQFDAVLFVFRYDRLLASTDRSALYFAPLVLDSECLVGIDTSYKLAPLLYHPLRWRSCSGFRLFCTRLFRSSRFSRRFFLIFLITAQLLSSVNVGQTL